MSIINNLDFHRVVSIMSISVIISLVALLIYFPVFSGNYFYDIGTIMIFSGDVKKIPYGWEICDGTKNTPDLTHKFVLGAWSSKQKKSLCPLVESLNNNKNYIGHGIDPILVENASTKIKGESLKALIDGNIPYLFGTSYKHSKFGENNELYQKYDHGTNWFKHYEYKKHGDNCKNGEAAITGKYYNNSKEIDLCKGTIKGHPNRKEEHYLMNDSSIMNKNKRLDIGDKKDKADFKYYFDTENEIDAVTQCIQPSINEIHTEVNDVYQTPTKRRLYRDYEDYKLYLQMGKKTGVSCYDCLPMNHSFQSHNYRIGIPDAGGNTINNIDSRSIDNIDTNEHLLSYNNTPYKIKEYMNDFVYDTPYSNTPSFYKLAYIIRVK
jgi:hypothetical protein